MSSLLAPNTRVSKNLSTPMKSNKPEMFGCSILSWDLGSSQNYKIGLILVFVSRRGCLMLRRPFTPVVPSHPKLTWTQNCCMYVRVILPLCASNQG